MNLPIRAAWCGVVLLVLIGVNAAVGRTIFLPDYVTRIAEVRDEWLSALGMEPAFLLPPEELALMDGRFAAHPYVTLSHVVFGALFLSLAPLQFSVRVRDGYRRFHRWSGRLLIVMAVITAWSGMYFGLLMPYGGPMEAVAIALFGGLFIFSLGRAYVAIRRRQIAQHREWMIRAFAIALAISTVRIIGVLLDLGMGPAGWGPRPLFVLSVWTGWIITVSAAELWIRYTRYFWVKVIAAPPTVGATPTAN